MRIVQLVVTDAFAGTERYVAQTSRELARRGHDVVVLGGDRRGMSDALAGSADWRSAPRPTAAVHAMLRVGRADIVHAHLTHAEVAASSPGPYIVARSSRPGTSRRHAARVRPEPSYAGSSSVGRRRGRDQYFVAAAVTSESPRQVHVVHNGVPRDESAYDVEARTVVMVQRLEAEKDTRTGLLAWQASGLASAGWSLVVVGDGAERKSLESLVSGDPSVRFVGHVADVPSYLRSAGILLATAPAEPFGLGRCRGMAAGVPVVASRSGGHLETVGTVAGAPMFDAGDVAEASRCLAELASDRCGARG